MATTKWYVTRYLDGVGLHASLSDYKDQNVGYDKSLIVKADAILLHIHTDQDKRAKWIEEQVEERWDGKSTFLDLRGIEGPFELA